MRASVLAGLLAAAVTLGTGLSQARGQEGVVRLRVRSALPPNAAITAHFIEPWMKKVAGDSDRRIELELVQQPPGVEPAGLFDAVREGVVDIVWTAPRFSPGRFPRSEIFDMPFLPASAEATSQAAWDFFQQHLLDEYPGVKVLAVNTHAPGAIHSRGPIATPADLAGKKLRAPTAIITRLIDKLGGIGLLVPEADVPRALENEEIDGALVRWSAVPSLRLDSHTVFSGERGLYTTLFVFAMNQAKYDALPADLKAVIDANSGRKTSEWAGQVMDEADAAGIEAAKDASHTFIELKQEDAAQWRAAAEPVISAWIEEMKGRNVDGKALYDDAVSLIAKYAKP